jgi:hypothetical protein
LAPGSASSRRSVELLAQDTDIRTIAAAIEENLNDQCRTSSPRIMHVASLKEAAP